MISEAHLAPADRPCGLIRYLPKRKRSFAGWAVFLGFIVLNETRGLYMVAEFLKAYQG